MFLIAGGLFVIDVLNPLTPDPDVEFSPSHATVTVDLHESSTGEVMQSSVTGLNCSFQTIAYSGRALTGLHTPAITDLICCYLI